MHARTCTNTLAHTRVIVVTTWFMVHLLAVAAFGIGGGGATMWVSGDRAN